MATTTSCIAALESLELIKLLTKRTTYQNTFLNLAIPYFMSSDPGECDKVNIYILI